MQEVIVDGALVVKDRRLLTVDLEEIRARLKQRRPEIMARFDAAVTA